jgi:hypothetical protein
MSETVQSTLFAAVFNTGALLNGTWTTTYNATANITSVTAQFSIFFDGQTTVFTAPVVSDFANPLYNGTYQIELTTATGGLFNSLYVNWTGELPTTLTIGMTEPYFLFTSVEMNGAPNMPIGLSAVSGTVVSAVVCYCAGTRIRTPDGDVAVEDLAVGQHVLSASGAARAERGFGPSTKDGRSAGSAIARSTSLATPSRSWCGRSALPPPPWPTPSRPATCWYPRTMPCWSMAR